MLSGKPPYEGNNFMEILHKKATTQPAPLSTLRDDIPPTLDALITRTLAKDPAARPQSMEELGRLLLDVGGMAYPSIGKIDLAFFDAAEATSSRQVAPPASAAHSTSALLTRLRSLERQKVVIAAGGLVGLVIAFIVVGAMSSKHPPKPAPVVIAAPVVAPPPVAVAPPVVAPPPVAPPEPEDEGESAADKEAATHHGTKPRGPVVPTAAESKKLLTEGQRLMRAERFPEARKIFEKLAQSKRDRGPALVGLAEISFQEKNYTQAVKSAQLAAERGGGVRARVLQGDANFRLNPFKEAAQAYEAALKLDPGNASAKSGLQLANKRM
jgi:hypothetical protein